MFFKGKEGKEGMVKLVEQLEQLDSNLYFLECFCWLFVNVQRLLSLRQKHQETTLPSDKDKSKLTEHKLKIIKYLLDLLSSYNNSSLAKHYGPINPKLIGFFTLISSCIGLYLMWR